MLSANKELVLNIAIIKNMARKKFEEFFIIIKVFWGSTLKIQKQLKNKVLLFQYCFTEIKNELTFFDLFFSFF